MNPAAQEIRDARTVAEGEILEAIRNFESLSGCMVRDVEVVRVCAGPVAAISTPIVMLEVDIGPTSRLPTSKSSSQEKST